MTLPWAQDSLQIIDSAQKEADRMRLRASTVLLLRGMCKCTSLAQEILRSLGVTSDSVSQIIRTEMLTPEQPDTSQRIYTRAMRLAMYARESEVSATKILLAMLDEDCLARSILCLLGLDIERLRTLIHNSETANLQYQAAVSQTSMARSHSTSMGAVAVCRKSPSQVMQYITPQPAVSFGSEYSAYESARPAVQNEDQTARRRLISPEEIAMLTGGVTSRPVEQRSYTPTPTQSQTAQKVSSSSSGALRSVRRQQLSARESQQMAAIDLAKRLRTKSRQMLAAAEAEAEASDDNDILEASNVSNENEMISSTPSAIAAAVSAEPDTPDSPEANEPQRREALSHFEQTKRLSASYSKASSIKSTGHAQIITRKTTTEVSKTPSINFESKLYSRASSPLPSGYNPFVLSPSKYPVLSQYGRNLLAAARDGKLDPVVERDHEIDQLIDILHKRRSNNPVLVGEAGVGKTAIIEGLALRMAQKNAPRGLENHTIIALDYGSLLCGTQLRGAVQERIAAIKKEVRQSNGLIILFLDEIHTWLAPTNGEANSDAALELKLALSRGELMCIGASTPAELRHAFDADPAFERRFDLIEVKAPNVKTAIQIIRNGIIKQYEEHHGVKYADEAISSAVKLANRYIQERALPDKALSVLDRAGSVCVRAGESEVTLKHIAGVISQLTEVPVERLLMTEKQKLMRMEEILGERLIGHEKNIERIAQVIRRNQAGFGAQRPIGSFLFLGPTGVGKTEAAKVLAEFLFGSRKSICRFDMSEYMEQHSVAKLIGAPAGYVGFDDGGLLTEALRKRPYQIVLFDEIEKAHPDVMNILLQILDEGRLTDAKGRHVDFSNCVVILTSNIGAQEVLEAARKGIGFSGKNGAVSDNDAEQIILKAARARFTPELYNRIEEKLVFHALTREQIERIASLLLNDSRKRLFDDKHIELHINEEAIIPYLIEHGGFDPMYGARPMRQTIQSHVESRIAEWILSHDDFPDRLDVDLSDDLITVTEP